MTDLGQAERRKFAELEGWLCVPHATPPKRLVILLHGWGADARDLATLSSPLSDYLPETAFFAADARDVCSANPFGRQWFDIEDRRAGPDYALETITPMLAAVQQAFNLSARQTGLAGFSQGGMMTLAAACVLPSPVAAAVSFSGALLNPDRLVQAEPDSPPVLLIHGSADAVVPPAALPAARQQLEGAGWQVEAEMRAGLGHGIDAEGIALAGRFLARHLE